MSEAWARLTVASVTVAANNKDRDGKYKQEVRRPSAPVLTNLSQSVAERVWDLEDQLGYR